MNFARELKEPVQLENICGDRPMEGGLFFFGVFESRNGIILLWQAVRKYKGWLKLRQSRATRLFASPWRAAPSCSDEDACPAQALDVNDDVHHGVVSAVVPPCCQAASALHAAARGMIGAASLLYHII